MREVLFYILDKKENKFIIVSEESEHGYKGVSVDNLLDHREVYIAKTFIENNIDRYDFSLEEPVLIPAIF
jgi:hypothetical protein